MKKILFIIEIIVTIGSIILGINKLYSLLIQKLENL